jgi:RNA polymerase sigma-70 factor (ECF subfamily)
MAPEAELLRAWQAGDVDAGDRLFRRHFASVRRFFRNKVPATEVEDLVQATFEACFGHSTQFRGESRFVCYLLAIARSQLHRWLRRRDPLRTALELEQSSLLELGVSPSDIVGGRERQQLVIDALRRIPLELQVVLELYYWEGLTGPEIAVVVDIDPVTVRTRLHRARTLLRDELATRDAALADLDTIDREARLVSELLGER